MVKKTKLTLFIFLTFTVLASTLAFAMTSDSFLPEVIDNGENYASADISSASPVPNEETCSSLSTRRLRISCMLSSDNMDIESTISEACANHQNKKACNAIYMGAKNCYFRQGAQKDLCFKQISNFKKSNSVEQSAINKAPVRNYIVLVLYDLQKNVESAHKGGRITSEEATELIDQIIEIKQAIFSQRSSSEIKPMVSQLKKDYLGVIPNE